jgi:hypothetical protein
MEAEKTRADLFFLPLVLELFQDPPARPDREYRYEPLRGFPVEAGSSLSLLFPRPFS